MLFLTDHVTHELQIRLFEPLEVLFTLCRARRDSSNLLMTHRLLHSSSDKEQITFVDDTLLYLENIEESLSVIRINEFDKVFGCRVNIEKSI